MRCGLALKEPSRSYSQKGSASFRPPNIPAPNFNILLKHSKRRFLEFMTKTQLKENGIMASSARIAYIGTGADTDALQEVFQLVAQELM